ncbi:hypothetical protein GPECTOR_14g213 [Gonium pectorale]|uniref:tRNA dimethylallyltransferase n=1 Tax=Gonium pectorale TaxID=33097 RepID=A0A150GNQ6_GONPE|nr:hypothetical protein GPECTOR_14g213 [Gonium pectorale]|eukprot:KXZ50970.1 hypothetical protein GPECTOR_14g213 [Gonium pectorale]
MEASLAADSARAAGGHLGPAPAPAPAAAGPADGAAGRRKPQVIILTGPTAVGKTAVSLLLAERLSGRGEGATPAAEDAEGGADGSPAGGGWRCEVISADSVQVYRGLDVGSDKLPVAERRGIPHHLIDVRGVAEDFSAGEFFECARPVAEDIVQASRALRGGGGRGSTPLVVGGTGLYLRWFVVGKGGAPRATPEALRAVQQAMQGAWAEAEVAKRARTAEAAAGAAAAEAEPAGEEGKAAMAERGAAAGAAGAEAADPGGLTEAEKWDAAAALLLKWGDEAAYARCFFLHRPRLALYDRIATRVEEMVVGGGLLEEAAGLLREGLAPGQNMAAKAIGYRQAMEWLVAARSSGRPVGLSDLAALHGSICQATHKLVRAQMTWFRDDPMYKWIDVDGRDPRDVVEEIRGRAGQAAARGWGRGPP